MVKFNYFKRINVNSMSTKGSRFSAKRLAGPGYIILNGLRACNIVVLLSVMAASMVMIVKTFTTSKFFFFDAVTHVITSVTAFLLLLSEIGMFKNYFTRVWPLLSPNHGFNFLGICMLIIGNNTLGNLNKEATSQESLGMPLWRLVIGAGIVNFVFGFINILISYIFRDARLGVTARQIRAKGAVAISDREVGLEVDEKARSITLAASSIYSSPSHAISSPSGATSPVRDHQYQPRMRSFFRQARNSFLPSYSQSRFPVRPVISKPEPAQPQQPDSPTPAPLNINPQFAHLIRPELAHHPSNRRTDGLAF